MFDLTNLILETLGLDEKAFRQRALAADFADDIAEIATTLRREGITAEAELPNDCASCTLVARIAKILQERGVNATIVVFKTRTKRRIEISVC